MNIYPYVYRLDNPVTGEFYIGFRCANKVPSEQDLGHKYFTSSKLVKPRFYEFNYQIIAEFFDKDDAFKLEQELIKENLHNNLLLNKSCFSNNTLSFIRIIVTDEHRRNISLGRQGIKFSAEHCHNISVGQRGKVISQETRLKLSNAGKNRILTDEHKNKIGQAHKNKFVTEDTRLKLSSHAKGRILSEEHKLRISLSTKGIPKIKSVCRVFDRKEMDIGNYFQWLKYQLI